MPSLNDDKQQSLPAMGIHIPHPSKWNHKHIILVAFAGTLAIITITAIISIILSPAHIFFTIENPSAGKPDEEETKYYNFTLVAHNRSPHMAVKYGALSADVWYSESAWVPAVVVDMSSLPQNGTSWQTLTNISMSAEYWQSEHTISPPATPGGKDSPPAATNETDWSNCTVLVTATVWFESRWISTRSYDVRANCSSVNFGNSSASIRCQEG